MNDFNPEVLIVGDLHIHERLEFPGAIGENPRLLDGLDILDQIATIVNERKIRYVIFTGDLFELKDKIPNHILVPFTQKIETIKKSWETEIIALRGNHDFKIPEFSTTSIFSSIMFIDDVFTIGLIGKDTSRSIGFIPFYRDWDEFKEKWVELHNRLPRPDIIMFHNELPGVYYSAKMKAPKEWDFPYHKDVSYVGGHIHKPQILKLTNNSIDFIGIPYQLDFDDVGTKTDYHVKLYDINTNVFKDVTLKYPWFVEINLDKKAEGIIKTKGNYVRIIGTVEPKDRPRVRQMRDTMITGGAKGVQVKVKYVTEHVSRIKAEKSDYRGVISQYLRGSATTLDRDKLLQTGLNLLEKSK